MSADKDDLRPNWNETRTCDSRVKKFKTLIETCAFALAVTVTFGGMLYMAFSMMFLMFVGAPVASRWPDTAIAVSSWWLGFAGPVAEYWWAYFLFWLVAVPTLQMVFPSEPEEQEPEDETSLPIWGLLAMAAFFGLLFFFGFPKMLDTITSCELEPYVQEEWAALTE